MTDGLSRWACCVVIVGWRRFPFYRWLALGQQTLAVFVRGVAGAGGLSSIEAPDVLFEEFS
jgi:hypothetical protein